MSIDVTGQLVIPQNTATIPAAAANSGGNPMICPHTHPKVAPIQNPGTISPPRNPALMVIAVKTIFHTKSRGRALPFIARAINSLPAHMYSLVFRKSVITITTHPATKTRIYGFLRHFV